MNAADGAGYAGRIRSEAMSDKTGHTSIQHGVAEVFASSNFHPSFDPRPSGPHPRSRRPRSCRAQSRNVPSSCRARRSASMRRVLAARRLRRFALRTRLIVRVRHRHRSGERRGRPSRLRSGRFALLATLLSGFVFIAPLICVGLWCQPQFRAWAPPDPGRLVRARATMLQAGIFAIMQDAVIVLWSRAGTMVGAFFPIDEGDTRALREFLAMGSAVGAIFLRRSGSRPRCFRCR
jgi:hypothetical protein